MTRKNSRARCASHRYNACQSCCEETGGAMDGRESCSERSAGRERQATTAAGLTSAALLPAVRHPPFTLAALPSLHCLATALRPSPSERRRRRRKRTEPSRIHDGAPPCANRQASWGCLHPSSTGTWPANSPTRLPRSASGAQGTATHWSPSPSCPLTHPPASPTALTGAFPL